MRRNGSNGRYRRMRELTSLPGWVRYGSSPGFSGGRGGRGICAEYLAKTSQMDDILKDLSENNPNYEQWQQISSSAKWNFEDQSKVQISEQISELEEELRRLKRILKDKR